VYSLEKLREWHDKKMCFEMMLEGAKCLRRSDAGWQSVPGVWRSDEEHAVNVFAKNVISDYSAWWNSAYELLNQLLLLKVAMADIVMHMNSAVKRSKVEEVLEILEPFAVQTDMLQKLG